VHLCKKLNSKAMLGFAQLCDEILIKNDLFLVSGKLQTRSKNSK